MFLNIGNLEKKRYWFGTQKVTLHPNKSPKLSLLYAITNEKTVKLMQVDRLLSASKTYPAETRSNNSGRYPLLKSHIHWVYRPELLAPVPITLVNRYTLLKTHIHWVYRPE